MTTFDGTAYGPSSLVQATIRSDNTVYAQLVLDVGPQNVVRVEQRRNGQFRRFWSLLLSDNTQVQTDFGAILVRPGDAISLAFIQDVDRDGLIAPEEFLHRSPDFKKDTSHLGVGLVFRQPDVQEPHLFRARISHLDRLVQDRLAAVPP